MCRQRARHDACANCFCCCFAAKRRSRCEAQFEAETVWLLPVMEDSVGEPRAQGVLAVLDESQCPYA